MGKYKEIEVEKYEVMLEKLSKTKLLDLKNFDLLIFGGGGQDKKFYRELKNNEKCEILWSGNLGPKWLSILFFFIPGQGGIIKIKDQTFFGDLYYELAAQSVSEVCYFPKNKSKELINEFIK